MSTNDPIETNWTKEVISWFTYSPDARDLRRRDEELDDEQYQQWQKMEASFGGVARHKMTNSSSYRQWVAINDRSRALRAEAIELYNRKVAD